MATRQQTYIPSPFTLTLLDNFGNRRLLHRPIPHSSSTTHMSQHRSDIKLKPAFDKESLLEQLRKEKTRSRQMKASSGFLKRQLSHSKQPDAALVHPPSHNSIEFSLKREIESLAVQLDQQALQINRIKASKKYNRYIELVAAKEVYMEQLKTTSKCSNQNAYALRQRKRMWKEHRKRQEDTQAMDRVVRNRLNQQNQELQQRITEEDEKIRISLQRQMDQIREKNRLVRDILQLQKLTGRLYIVEGEGEESPNNQDALQPPPNLYSKESKTQHDSEQYQQYKQQNCNGSEQEDSSLDQQQSSQSSQVDDLPPPRRHNVSF